jgi:hypothetical protein
MNEMQERQKGLRGNHHFKYIKSFRKLNFFQQKKI